MLGSSRRGVARVSSWHPKVLPCDHMPGKMQNTHTQVIILLYIDVCLWLCLSVVFVGCVCGCVLVVVCLCLCVVVVCCGCVLWFCVCGCVFVIVCLGLLRLWFRANLPSGFCLSGLGAHSQSKHVKQIASLACRDREPFDSNPSLLEDLQVLSTLGCNGLSQNNMSQELMIHVRICQNFTNHFWLR